MASKNEQLEQLSKAIADADIRLKSIQMNIEKISAEISVLSPKKSELKQNIEFHKKEGTVPIAHEFKKARAELSKTTARLILLTSDLKKSQEACQQVIEIIDKFKNDQAALLKTSENNVLRPKFGANRGQE
jgi:chromosome segregation ATPase